MPDRTCRLPVGGCDSVQFMSTRASLISKIFGLLRIIFEPFRLAYNAVITMVVRTHKKRWKQVSQEEPPWDERNRLIASFIPENSAVIDLGCGARTLQRYLKPGCSYQPCDLIQSAPEVLLCDFNAGLYPAVTRKYDYVICSGVLEYIRNPVEFLSRISALGKVVILSYNPIFDGQTKFFRLGWNWVNHFTRSEIEQMLRNVGFREVVLFERPPKEITYELRKGDSGGGDTDAPLIPEAHN